MSHAVPHEGSADSAATGASQSQFYRTKICPFHLKHQLRNPRYQGLFASNVGCPEGTCAAGSRDCRFAHSLRELRPLPDLTRTKLCPSFQRQVECKLADCPFAHSPHDLRTSSSVFYKVSLCNFYKANKCWNGANCRFAHGNQELRLNTELMRSHMAMANKRELNESSDELPSLTTAEPSSSNLSVQADYALALTRGTSATPGCSWALGTHNITTNALATAHQLSSESTTAPDRVKEKAYSIHHPAYRRGMDSLTTIGDADLHYGSLTSLSQISETEHAILTDAAVYNANLSSLLPQPSLGGLDEAAEELLRLLELDH